MRIAEAMYYFGITESQLISMTDKQLKKIYISLIKKNHPDLVYGNDRVKEYGDRTKDINIAYDILVKFKGENRGTVVGRVIKDIKITLKDLIAIRSGEKREVVLRYSDGTEERVVLSNRELGKYRVLVQVDYEIQGVRRVGYVVFNGKDNYELNTAIDINECNLGIRVSVLDKSIDTVLNNRYTELNFKFEHYIMIRLNIERNIQK